MRRQCSSACCVTSHREKDPCRLVQTTRSAIGRDWCLNLASSLSRRWGGKGTSSCLAMPMRWMSTPTLCPNGASEDGGAPGKKSPRYRPTFLLVHQRVRDGGALRHRELLETESSIVGMNGEKGTGRVGFASLDGKLSSCYPAKHVHTHARTASSLCSCHRPLDWLEGRVGEGLDET